MNSREVIRRKMFHCYMDEGGVFGDCHVLVSRVKVKSLREESVRDHYFGLMSIESFQRHIDFFQRAYPKCKVIPYQGAIPNWYLVLKETIIPDGLG